MKDMLGDFCDIQFLSHEEVQSNRMTEQESGETRTADQDFFEILTGYEFEQGASR